LLAGEDQALLIGRDALLVLDLAFHIVNRVARLDLERDRLAREGLDEAVQNISSVSRGGAQGENGACRLRGAILRAYICTVHIVSMILVQGFGVNTYCWLSSRGAMVDATIQIDAEAVRQNQVGGVLAY